ncbi:MAG: hydantoinase/oxoprolinase family protein [Zavarzinella sp.]
MIQAKHLGIDIGGANIKVALPNGHAISRPLQLWRYPERLVTELATVRSFFGKVGTLAVTMTGELCDCYPTKREGVAAITEAVTQAFPNSKIMYWSTEGRFIDPEQATQDYLRVASSNWHALATAVARHLPERYGMLIDIGSTTTDLIPIQDRKVLNVGLTDPERLRSGSLLYTGVRRTPICAVLQHAICAELFATTQDAYVLLGHLVAQPESTMTADGRPLTVQHAHTRLARMLGGDGEMIDHQETATLAARVRAVQMEMLLAAIDHIESQLDSHHAQAFVMTGSGEFLIRAALEERRIRRPDKPFRDISMEHQLGPHTSASACAHAVASLASYFYP